MDLPSLADRRRLRDARARARARIAVEEAGRLHRAELDAVFREEIGSTVRSVSPFLASLMAVEGYSLDEVVKGIRPAPGWPHRPRLGSGGVNGADSSRHLVRYYAASLLSRQGKVSLFDPAQDVWVTLSDGGWARIHIAGHSLEVDARIGASRLATRFGRLRVEVPPMGMTHPRDPSSRVDIVMTTDIVIDVVTPDGPRIVPYAVKTVEDLAKRSVQRKFELERRYWASLGMKLGLLTDRQLRGRRFENIRWLRDWHWTKKVQGYDAARWARIAEVAMHIVASMQGRSIGEVCSAIAAAEGITPGTALSTLRHLGARKRLLIDVELPRPLLRDPIERFALPASAALAGVAA